MFNHSCVLLSLSVLALSAQSAAFCFNSPKPFVRYSLVSAKDSEFSLAGDDARLPDLVRGSDFNAVQQSQAGSEFNQDGTASRPEYGALAAGTVVQVQVGDLSLARKAWKKRRRTGSPLLVPCSILNIDQRSMVRWNLMFLLEKFGQAQADGVRITASELTVRYRKFLKSSLQKQAIALGYESNEAMISDLFNKKVQEAYGIRLIEQKDGKLTLRAPISRTKAQKRAANTPILQFRAPKPGDQGESEGMLTHTGFLRSRKANQDPTDRSYHFLPLSAALRVSQKDDVDTGRIEDGSVHPAVVFDYDLNGDGGSPLLILSLNPRGIRENLKVKPDRKYQPIDTPQVEFQNLRVGDGPYRAKVVRLLHGRALIDMDVGRKLSSEGMVRVIGTLRYQDAVQAAPEARDVAFMDGVADDDEDYDFDDELGGNLDDVLFNFDDEEDDDNDDEEEQSIADDLLALRGSDSFEDGTFEEDEFEEDVSDHFSLAEDGTLSYTDPETGETVVMGSVDTDDDEDDEDEDDEDYEDNQEEEMEASSSDDEDEDFDFDVRSLFEQNDDGSMAFIDPDSGETLEVNSGDEEYEDMMMIKSLIDKYSAPPSPKNVDYTYTKGAQANDHSDEETDHSQAAAKPTPRFVSKRLRVGEDIDVYVRAVSKQSGQFTVSTNPTVKGQKAKDLKKEVSTSKKLNRLKNSLGGSLQKIYDLEGHECTGVIKATSQTGEWFYVEPEFDGLPVGVATIMQGFDTELAAGDHVRVRIAGVDEERGQLAMELLGKI